MLEKRNFTGGLNSDLEERLIPNGDYRYALNSRSGSSDKDNIGSIENTKGNTLVSFAFNLPINKVIGSFENKTTAKIYYFVYSAFPPTPPGGILPPSTIFTHGIYEYDITLNTITVVLQSTFLNFNPDFLITGVSMVDDTLFFTDNVENNDVRMVDVPKAKLYMRKATTIWTFDDNTFNPGSFLGFISSASHAFVVGDKVQIQQFDPFTFSQYNSVFTITSIPNATSIITDGIFLGVTPPEGGTATLFNDGYPVDFLNEHITLIRKPPSCQPELGFGSDSTATFNYLTDKLFQFKYRYVYWNNMKSAYSPISDLLFPSDPCSVDITTVNNFIQVAVLTSDSTVTKIEIVAREGNIGNFFSIIVLDKLLLNIVDNITYNYNFYNEKVYNNIDINESIKLYDFIPRWAKGLDYIDGERIGIANGTDGFDLPKIDTCTKIDFSDAPVSATTTTTDITGIIRISNYFSSISNYNNFQPIHQDGTSAPYVFGGFGTSVQGVVNGLDANYHQIIPLGGFVVYLAGTDYYAVSKQVPGANGTQNTAGVYLSDTTAHKNGVRSDITSQNTKSQFTIPKVPPGIYIMRIASHYTVASDLTNSTRDYQKTSTNTRAVCGIGGPECIVEVLAAGGIKINGVTYSNGVVPESSSTVIADLTKAAALSSSLGLVGYVTDKDITTPIVTTADALADTRIHAAFVTFNISSIFGSLNFATNFLTDHNGYFFGTTSPAGLPTLNINTCTSGVNSLGSPTLTLLKYDNPAVPFTGVSGAKTGQVIIRNNNNGVSSFSRTKITGNIKSSVSGLGVQGASVISSKGGAGISDPNGFYDFFVYINTSIQPIRNDTLYFSNNATTSCQFSFSKVSELYGIAIFPTSSPQTIFVSPYNSPGGYDFDSLVLIEDILAASLGGEVVRALKRGGEYQVGIVYYDNFNRSTTTITTDSLKLKIPFYNQDVPTPPVGINSTCPLYLTGAGIGKGAFSFQAGYPIVSWAIKNDPPAWATHYQWVRTKNSAINRYLQFMPQEVVFIDDNENTTTAILATQIKIKINLAGYKTKYPDSILSYDFVDEDSNLIGDRIRFIKQGNVYYSTVIDIKVLKFKDGYIYFYNQQALHTLDLTSLFEVYTPKLKLVDDIFYEMSECLDIIKDSTGRLVHEGGTNGQTQKQWTFTDNKFEPGGVLGFISNKNHNIVVGDIVRVVQNAGATFTQYNTTYLVTGVPNSKEIIVNGVFLGATPANGGTIYVDAIGEFTTGDAYYRYRDIVTSSPSASINTFIDDVNVSDFYVSDFSDIGRPSRIDNNFKQITRPTTVWYSEKFIPETNINGLNSFFDINFEIYDRKFGSIQKIYSEDHYLIVFQELKVGAIPVNRTIMIDNAGQSVVGTSAKVLNQIQYYAGEYGISKNPESFAVYAKRKYFTDLNRGVALRLSIDGLTPTSEYRMHNYFTKLFKSLADTGINPKMYGTYDVLFNEYVLGVETTGSVPGATIAFNEKTNRWSTFYSYNPEYFGTSGTNIVSFKSGQLYTHNTNIVYNNFYGIQGVSEVHVPSNEAPSNEKVFKSVSEESTDVWVCDEILTQNGQKTNLIASDFELIENIFYASLWMDENTPNISNPLIEGDPLRDASALFKFKNTNTGFVKMLAINVNWLLSERSNK